MKINKSPFFIRVFFFTLLSACMMATWAAERVALVIGNNEYKYATPLNNPVNDARAVGAMLQKLGFEVILQEDVSRVQFYEGWGKFKRQSALAKVGLVYFAGHGMEHEDKNYLLPVDVELKTEDLLEAETIPLDMVLRNLRDTRIETKLVVLDCCRNNPLSRSWMSTRSAQGGLAEVTDGQMPKVTMLMFSTAPGGKTSDEDGKNSPFTVAFVKRMSMSGQSIFDAFLGTSDDVLRATGQQQKPWVKFDGSARGFRELIIIPKEEIEPVNAMDTQTPSIFSSKDVITSLTFAQNGTEAGVVKCQDYEEAVEWLHKVAEQGNARGQNNLGVMYENGKGVEKDEKEAVRWYRKAAEQGEARGQNNLGVMYADGRGVEKDEKEAARWYRKAAEQGNARGQTNLGAMYADGRGVEKDEKEAARWYRKAAKQGEAYGQYNLGFMYENGKGVEKDEKEAVRWYRKAAEQGEAYGQVNLGVMYADGRGVEKDEKEAVKWYRKAAEQGEALGQTNLGAMYADGIGVGKDEKEAVRWYRKAAEQGEAVGQNNLGVMYENGKGVDKDEKEAVRWYRKAAEQGEALGQYNLGVMYENGKGVKKSTNEAVKWYRKAAANGDKTAQEALKRLDK